MSKTPFLKIVLLALSLIVIQCGSSQLPQTSMIWDKITIPGDIQKIEKAPNGITYVTDLWEVSCGDNEFEIIPTLPNHIVHYKNGEATVEKIGNPDINFIATRIVDFHGTRIYGGNGLYLYKKDGDWIQGRVPVIDEKMSIRYTTMYESFLGFTIVQDRLYAAIHEEDQIFQWNDGQFTPIRLHLPPKFKKEKRQTFLVKAIASDDRFIYVAGKYTREGGLGSTLLITSAKEPLTDKTEWQQVTIPGRGWPIDLEVTPSGDVWIAGEGSGVLSRSGLLVQYQNGKMIDHSKKIPAPIHDVNVLSNGHVVTAGDKGFLGHWDGAAWHQVEFPIQDTLFGVCVLADGKAYVVGKAGLAYRSQNSL